MGGEPAARRGGPLPEGVELREGKRGPRLRVCFYWNGERRRETLDIPATPANVKYAARLRAEVINAIERGTFDYARTFPNSKAGRAASAVAKTSPTVGKLVEDYIQQARITKTLSPSTIAGYAKIAKRELMPQWGDRLAEDVAAHEVRAWLVDMVRKVSPKTVRNVAGLLAAVLTRAASDDIIQESPMARISLRTIIPRRSTVGTEREADPFTDAEVSAILAAAKSIEERSLWQFAFATGLRTGELIALKWGSIDWIKMTVTVKEAVVSGEVGAVAKDTKTGNVYTVPLLPAAIAALEAMKPITMLAGQYVFKPPGPSPRWRSDNQIRELFWRRTLLAAGVRYRNPYQTRHTFASRLLMSGESELLVARLLGHATTEMVRRHYGKYIEEACGVTLKGDYSRFGLGEEDEKLGADLGQKRLP